jgi:ribosome modulation factor
MAHVCFIFAVLKNNNMTANDKKSMVFSDRVLKSLCQEYLVEIGLGLYDDLPNIKVRYVVETNKFGYAYFGDFFFFDDDFYVWDDDERWKDDHNQDVVEAVFQDRHGRSGYAHRVIFAGVETELADSNGERIFTGDVIKLEESAEYVQYYAVGAWAHEDGGGCYCFILDNHYLPLEECVRRNYKMTRMGTVFYQLDASDFMEVNKRTMQFNGWRDTEEDRQRKLLMAKFTPNFDQEEWKYSALEIIGAEYNWKD